MQLLLPMSVLMLLTFIVLILMVLSRITAVQSKRVKAGYFKLYNNKSDQEIPKHIIQIGKNFSNLMEMTPLFYITCLIYMHLNQINDFVIVLAWGYVAFRLIHSIIHITSNHVLYRMLTFAAGCVSLMIMWINLIGKNFL
jgi:hypothetical protein